LIESTVAATNHGVPSNEQIAIWRAIISMSRWYPAPFCQCRNSHSIIIIIVIITIIYLSRFSSNKEYNEWSTALSYTRWNWRQRIETYLSLYVAEYNWVTWCWFASKQDDTRWSRDQEDLGLKTMVELRSIWHWTRRHSNQHSTKFPRKIAESLTLPAVIVVVVVVVVVVSS